MRPAVLLAFVLFGSAAGLTGCRKTPAAPAPAVTATTDASQGVAAPGSAEGNRSYVPAASCPLPPSEGPATMSDNAGDRPDVATSESAETAEDAARAQAAHALFNKALDASRFDEALACAQVVSRLTPDDTTGHLDRALALDSLSQTQAAHHAYERAVALSPDDPSVLVSAADFLMRSGDDDSLETAVLYARRGRERAPTAAEGSQLAAIESRSLNDLGRSDEALRASESSLALDSDSAEAEVERGVALFEIIRFDEAEKALAAAHVKNAEDARAAYYLGLVTERHGRNAEADALLAQATALDPDTYPAPLPVSRADFQKVVDEETRKLTPEARHDLETTQFSWVDIPEAADLKAGDPVLSPEIVGVFRPGEDGHQDSIVLYRKNLLRVVRTAEDLHTEVRDTLLHELGHLHGENDEELRDRGL